MVKTISMGGGAIHGKKEADETSPLLLSVCLNLNLNLKDRCIHRNMAALLADICDNDVDFRTDF